MDPKHPDSFDQRSLDKGPFNTERARNSLEIGPFRVTPVDAGTFRLDGGAMFGVVPKTLWSRVIESDELNRIPMAMRCMLVESAATGRIYLVDTGAGTKFDRKMSSIYNLSYGGGEADDGIADPLTASLQQLGLRPEDITDVIFTHLHFDHCGGAVKRIETEDTADSERPTAAAQEANGYEITFPRAAHHVSKRQWDTATAPNAREKASFLNENIEPLQKALERGILLLEEDHTVFEPGFDTLSADGHTLGQWLPRLKGALHKEAAARGASGYEPRSPEETTLLYAADLIPTRHHVPLPWVMGYDMRPLLTLEEKQRLLTQAAKEHWMFFLEHDPIDSMIFIREDEKGRFSAVPISSV